MAEQANEDSVDDQRLAELRGWLADEQGLRIQTMRPASSDASFRRYFRVQHSDGEAIAMDAPPATEDCRPFVKVAGLMRDAGVRVPAIMAQDLERGFLLLEDLGRHTYLDVLSEKNADALFEMALDALIRWQKASRPEVLPDYDAALLQRELMLFPDWYLERALGLELSTADRDWLQAWFDRLVARALDQTRVFVHRDYMPRNLMFSMPPPGVLDFQDAVYGPLSYDVSSLLRDAFISWPADKVDAWLALYWERAGKAGIAVPTEFGAFRSDCTWMGVQRHLKVLGIFARIHHRDGKPRYLQDAPRFLAYLDEAAAAEPELAPLVRQIHDWRGEAECGQ